VRVALRYRFSSSRYNKAARLVIAFRPSIRLFWIAWYTFHPQTELVR
jgi:hypothetical protein